MQSVIKFSVMLKRLLKKVSRLMKKSEMPTVIRIAAAIWTIGSITVFFCDFAGLTGLVVPGVVGLQLVPALLRGSFAVVAVILLVTMIFGRVYCSVVCPLGILQDVATRLSKRGRLHNRKGRWFRFERPRKTMRLSILAVVTVSVAVGTTTLLSLLDPYSNFGRIATGIFRPVVTGVNNTVSWAGERFGYYGVYHVTLHTVELWSAVTAVAVLAVVVVMSYRRGRLLCNTVCPVGTLLGLFSRFSPFTIQIDRRRCVGCSVCEMVCKAQCIDSERRMVDSSRCVMCLNCTKVCRRGGVKYGLRITNYETMIIDKQLKATYKQAEGLTGNKVDGRQDDVPVNGGRRSFLLAAAAVAASLPVASAWSNGRDDAPKRIPITPPGSQGVEHFKHHCTACHLCVTHCPQQILKPAAAEFGFGYLFKPHLSFYEMGYCNYNCTVCSEICPNGAIHRLTKEEKRTVQIGIAEFDRTRCVVYTESTSCGACSEHCPTQAVRMVDYVDGLTVPEVTAEICIGCGACESICPVRPVKAINVKANAVHRTAALPEDEQLKEIDSEDLDFGF